MQASKAKDSAVFDARNSAQTKVNEATQDIEDAMFCTCHNRLCYKTWDDKCGVYTGDNVLDHATMLVSVLSLYFLFNILTIFQGVQRSECCSEQDSTLDDVKTS